MGVAMFNERYPQINTTNFAAADTTVAKTVLASLVNFEFARVDSILVSNSDSIAHNVDFTIQNGGNLYNIGSVAVPAGTGLGGTPCVEAVKLLFPSPLNGITHSNEGHIQAKMEVTITTGQVSVTVYWGVMLP